MERGERLEVLAHVTLAQVREKRVDLVLELSLGWKDCRVVTGVDAERSEVSSLCDIEEALSVLWMKVVVSTSRAAKKSQKEPKGAALGRVDLHGAVPTSRLQ